MDPQPRARPRVGISSCILGNAVRYDGDHKRHGWIADELARQVDWVPICPEVEMGMGIPREPVHLVADAPGGVPRMLGVDSAIDHTANAHATSARILERIAGSFGGLDGYILKRNSPSCGMERVKIHDPNGSPRGLGTGLFAQALRQRFPLLPITEECGLDDPHQREHFIMRVYAWLRLRQLEPTGAALRDFHQSYEPILRDRNPEAGRRLAQLATDARKRPIAEVLAEYRPLFMNTIREP
jgi:uncharacterized protein YbbK (DUF523 family)